MNEHLDRDAEIVREITVMIDELVPLRNAEPDGDIRSAFNQAIDGLNLLASKLSERHS
jgi:hypothetical protein